MTNDTQNSLTDFDMCLALAQKAINSQMAAAWESWIARSELSETSEMKDFALVSIYDNEFKTSGLEVEFDPLTVSLYVPNGKLGQVEVTLHLKSGTVFSEKVGLTRSERREIDNAVEDMIAEAVKKGEISSAESKNDSVFDKYTAEYKKQNPEKFREKYNIKNWSISFLTDLDKKPCDRELLKQIAPKVDKVVEQYIEAAKGTDGLPDSVFSIEYLFMKFTKVDLLLSDNKNINFAPDVPDKFSLQARTRLNTLLQGKAGDFMLGTVVHRSKTNSKGSLPTFALTDFIFNVKADQVPEASTLSYLGMFSGRSLPSNVDTARIALQDNWVRPEMLDGKEGSISGTMAISKKIFMNEYLIPNITKSLKPHFDDPEENADSLSWSYKLNQEALKNGKSYERKEDVVVREYTIAREGQINVSLQKRTSQLKVFGFAKCSIHYQSYFKLVNWDDFIPGWNVWKNYWKAGNSIKNLIEGENWNFDASLDIEGQQDFSVSINLSGTGGTSDFNVETKLEPHEISDWFKPIEINENAKGTVKWTDNTWFGDHIATTIFELFDINGGKTPNSLVKELNRDVTQSLRQIVQNHLQNIEINMKNQAFIPPGGGVFTFQNLRFSDAGDLLLDVIYKAP